MAPDRDSRDAVRQLERERDHLLLLHEALTHVERAPSLDAKLRVLVDAIRRVGFGRVTITLRDEQLNATRIVTAGLTAEEDAMLRSSPVPGHVWRRRMEAIERFRVSGSYYLDGRDPWVIEEFQGGLPSALSPSDDTSWSPRDALLVPLRSANGKLIATLVLDDPADRARPTLMHIRTVELFGQQAAAMLEHASLMALAERRAQRLQQLQEAGSVLASSLDEASILPMLAGQVETVLPVVSVVVCSTDGTGMSQPRALRRAGRVEDEASVTERVRGLAEHAGRTQSLQRSGNTCAFP
jgi:hypothetical protein